MWEQLSMHAWHILTHSIGQLNSHSILTGDMWEQVVAGVSTCGS